MSTTEAGRAADGLRVSTDAVGRDEVLSERPLPERSYAPGLDRRAREEPTDPARCVGTDP